MSCSPSHSRGFPRGTSITRESSPSIRRSRSKPDAPLHPLIQRHQDNTMYFGSNTGPCYVERSNPNTVKYSVEGTCTAKLGYAKVLGGDAFLRCTARVKDSVWVAESDGSVTIRDPSSAEVKRIIETKKQTLDKSISGRVQTTADDYCTRPPGHILSFTAVHDKVWAGCNDGKIHIYSSSGRKEKELKHHSGPITCIIYAQSKVFTGSVDFKVCVWDALTQTYIKMLHGHKMAVRSIFAALHVAYTGSDDTNIIMWATSHSEYAKDSLHPPGSPARRVAPGSFFQLKTLSGHKGDVLCLTYCKDYLWSGSTDCTIRIWNPLTQECKSVLPHHNGWVHVLRVMGSRVWSASHDGSICIWSGSTLSLLHRIENPHGGLLHDVSIACTTTQYTVWSVGGDQTVRFWNVIDVNSEDTTPNWDELEFTRERSLQLENTLQSHSNKQAKLAEMLETAHNMLVTEKHERELAAARISRLEHEGELKDNQINDMLKGYEGLAEKHSKMKIMSNAFRENVQQILESQTLGSPGSDSQSEALLRKSVSKIQELKDENERLTVALQATGGERALEISDEVHKLTKLLAMRTSIIESLKEKRREGEALLSSQQSGAANPLQTADNFDPHNPQSDDETYKSIQYQELLQSTLRQLSRKCNILRTVLPHINADATQLRDLVETESADISLDWSELQLDRDTESIVRDSRGQAASTLESENKEITRLQAELDQQQAAHMMSEEQLKTHLAERENELKLLKVEYGILQNCHPEEIESKKEIDDQTTEILKLKMELAACEAERSIAEQTLERLYDGNGAMDQEMTKFKQEILYYQLIPEMGIQVKFDEDSDRCYEAIVSDVPSDKNSPIHIKTADGNITSVPLSSIIKVTDPETTPFVAVRDLRAINAAKEAMLQHIQSENTSLTDQLALTSGRVATISGTCDDLQSTLNNNRVESVAREDALQTQIETLRANQYDPEFEPPDNSFQIASLRNQLEESLAKNRELSSQMNGRMRQLEEGLESARRIKESQATETAMLERKLETQDASKLQLASEVAELKDELLSAKKEIANVGEDGVQDRTTVANLVSRLQAAEDEIESTEFTRHTLTEQLTAERDKSARLKSEVDANMQMIREFELKMQLQRKDLELLKIRREGHDSLTVSSDGGPTRSPSPVHPIHVAEAVSQRRSQSVTDFKTQVDEAHRRAADTRDAADELRMQTRQLIPQPHAVQVLKTVRFKSGKEVLAGSTGTIIHSAPVKEGMIRVKIDGSDLLGDFQTHEIARIQPPQESSIGERTGSSSPLPKMPISDSLDSPPSSPKNPQLGRMVRLVKNITSGSRSWPAGTYAHIILEESNSCSLQIINSDAIHSPLSLYAHDVPNWKIDFNEIPKSLYVVMPAKPPADGKYLLMDNLVHNGYPVWFSDDKRIRMNAHGAWMIGDVNDLREGLGWGISRLPQEGILPHQIDIWQTFHHHSDPWSDDLTVRVTAHPLQTGGSKQSRSPSRRLTSPSQEPNRSPSRRTTGSASYAEAVAAAEQLKSVSASGNWHKVSSQHIPTASPRGYKKTVKKPLSR